MVAALKPWFEKQLSMITSGSTLAEDIRYALNHWQGLTRFLEDGRLELDTNPVENAIRPVCLTRKNALFAGHEVGAENRALLVSLVATCKLNDVNPAAYIAETLEAIIDGHPHSRIEDLIALAVPQNVKPASVGQRLSAYVRRQQAFEKRFKAYPIDYFHIDITELQTAEGGQALPLCRHRSHQQIHFVQLIRKTGRTLASGFLEALIAAVLYKINTVLTDNGIQFTFPPRRAYGPTARYATHMFDMRCQENGIEHRRACLRREKKQSWTGRHASCFT